MKIKYLVYFAVIIFLSSCTQRPFSSSIFVKVGFVESVVYLDNGAVSIRLQDDEASYCTVDEDSAVGLVGEIARITYLYQPELTESVTGNACSGYNKTYQITNIQTVKNTPLARAIL